MKYGRFDNEKREYVIERVDLPTSWTNYLGVEETCAVLNHTAGGYLFHQTPEYHRVTRFRGNGVPMDRPGHYGNLYKPFPKAPKYAIIGERDKYGEANNYVRRGRAT
jgi:cellobiose phosphorylase